MQALPTAVYERNFGSSVMPSLKVAGVAPIDGQFARLPGIPFRIQG